MIFRTGVDFNFVFLMLAFYKLFEEAHKFFPVLLDYC